MTDLSVANTIRDQIGNRAFVMIGGKKFRGDEKSLTFSVGKNAKGVNWIRVTLLPSDTYRFEALKASKKEVKVLFTRDVYVENLCECIEEATGMYTRL